MSGDPKRMFEQADELGAALRAAQHARPSEATLARIASAASAVVPAPVSGSSPSPAASDAAKEAAAAPVSPGSHAAGATFATTTKIMVVVALASAGLVGRRVDPVASTRDPAVVASDASAARPVVDESVQATELVYAPDASDVPRVLGAPDAPAANGGLDPHQARGRDLGVPPAAVVASSDEYALIDRAERALRASPSDALRITEQHRLAYRDGELAQEREVIAIEALARLGRADLARERLRIFRTAYPKSGHLVRLEAMLRAAAD